MKKILFASLLAALAQTAPAAADKVLYDETMGPQTPMCDPLPEQPREPDYTQRDQNFDELPPESDWPSQHEDPYPQELIQEINLDIHN